jgi:hypothetical protein
MHRNPLILRHCSDDTAHGCAGFGRRSGLRREAFAGYNAQFIAGGTTGLGKVLRRAGTK